MATVLGVDRLVLLAAFNAAGLSEVDNRQLEGGTYTNAQIITMMSTYPSDLFGLILSLPSDVSAPSKRRQLSLGVDVFLKGKQL